MQNVPFFPQLLIYGPIIAGIYLIYLSFNQKQYSAMIDNFGEQKAKKANVFLRYGGLLSILIGVVQFFIKDF